VKGLKYNLSIPKFVFSQVYHKLNKGRFPAIFPNLKYYENLPEPQLNGENWVILKSVLSGICGSDQNMLLGNESFSMEPYASFPCVMGHENVSIVVKCGSGVKSLKAGDKVIINPSMGCKVHDVETPCQECSQGNDALCQFFGDEKKLGAGMSLGYHKATGGGWSDFYQAHKSQIYKINDQIPNDRAVLADPFSSIMQPIAEYAKGKKEKKKVFIYGAGTIGLLGVAAIRALDLPWDIAVGYRYDFQGELAKDLGADHIVRTGKGLFEKVATYTNGKVRKVSIGKPVLEGGFDTIFDCVGSPVTIDNSLRFSRNAGSVIMVATGHNLAGVDATPLWFREVKMQGTCMSRDVIDPRDGKKKAVYEIVAEVLESLEIEKIVTHKFGLKDFKKALRVSMDKKKEPVVKVVFDPSL